MRYKILAKEHNDKDCFVCGVDNQSGLHAEFYQCEREDSEKVMITKFTARDIHQSYPNRMHGGIISALLDESIGRAVSIIQPNTWAVTIDLNIKFRKPVPLNTTLYIESQITELGSRSFDGIGKMMDSDGNVLATATARYFRLTIEQAVQSTDVQNINRYYLEEDLPKFFVIGS